MAELTSAQTALRVCSKLRRIIHRDGRMIVISSMPKSGSTFLTRSIAGVTGYQHTYLGCDYGNIEQELYLPKVIDAYGRGTVTQQHFKANEHNLSILASYGIRPVVLVRNIFDVLVSVRDHLEQEKLDNLPGVHVGPELLELDLEQQFDFVIDQVAPWFIAYFVSWCKAEAEGFPFLWMSYEEAAADWPRAVSRVLQFNGAPQAMPEITRAVEGLARAPREKTRLNRGVVGRGRTSLSGAQRERVLRLTRFYRLDFTRLGIDQPADEFVRSDWPSTRQQC